MAALVSIVASPPLLGGEAAGGDVSVEVCVGSFDHDVEPNRCWRRASRR